MEDSYELDHAVPAQTANEFKMATLFLRLDLLKECNVKPAAGNGLIILPIRTLYSSIKL
jgi:hypothetical protein